MAEYEDDETEGLFDIMEENSYFAECFRRYDSVTSFLKRDERIRQSDGRGFVVVFQG